MPTGFAVLGAMTASWGLFKDIVTFLKTAHGGKTAILGILLRFENDTVLLASLEGALTVEAVGSLQHDDLEHLQHVFSYLLPRLQSVSARLRRYGKNTIWDKTKWGVVAKDLESDEEDIFLWVQRLQACLVLLPQTMRKKLMGELQNSTSIASPLITTMATQQSIELKLAEFQRLGAGQRQNAAQDPQFRVADAGIVRLAPSTEVQVTTMLGSLYVLEFKRLPAAVANDPDHVTELQEEVVKLVTVFTEARPFDTFLLRPIKFFHSDIVPTAPYGIHYALPEHCTPPRTLTEALEEKNADGSRVLEHSLDQRFELARQIATALLFIHSLNWVHKGVCASNIVLTHKPTSNKTLRQWPKHLGTAYLVGFDFSRRAFAHSTGNEAIGLGWYRKLYQHPSRADLESTEEQPFTLNHDIYALGVLLVEIGRWKTLRRYSRLEKSDAFDNKKHLEDFAESLQVTLGHRYVNLTLRCLRVLDDSERGRHDPISVRNIVLELEDLAAATR
jgi:Protein tyrosine and serine/threonine kinase